MQRVAAALTPRRRRDVTNDHRDDPGLADSIERYLDGDLPPGERHALELRLRADAAAQTLFNEALATRALVELALGDEPGGEAKPCLRARGLVPGYHQGLLDADETALVAGHLDRCRWCSGWYDGYVEARRGPSRTGRSRSWLATLAVTIVAIVGVFVVSDPFGGDGRERSGDAATQEAPLFHRGVAPLGADEIGELMRFVDSASVGQRPDVTTIFARAYQLVPAWIDGLPREPLIAAWLRRLGVPGERRKITSFILGLGMARNVRIDARRAVLDHLGGTVGDDSAREFFDALADVTRDEDEFDLCVANVARGMKRPRDLAWAEKMWGIADRRGFRRSTALLLELLGQEGHPLFVRHCRNILEGEYGRFHGRRFPNAAPMLLLYSKGRPDLERVVEEYAESGKFGPGRARCVLALASAHRDDQRWKTSGLALIADEDADVRLLGLKFLEDHPALVDLDVLRTLRDTDPDPRVRSRARANLSMFRRGG